MVRRFDGQIRVCSCCGVICHKGFMQGRHVLGCECYENAAVTKRLLLGIYLQSVCSLQLLGYFWVINIVVFSSKLIMWCISSCQWARLRPPTYMSQQCFAFHLFTDPLLLSCPCYQGCTDVLQLLLPKEASADVANKSGFTALHLAAMGNHVATTQKLLQLGVKLSSTCLAHGSALHYAAGGGYCDVMRLLIKAGADVDLKVPQALTIVITCCSPSC